MHRAQVLEYDVAGPALGQSTAALLADPLERVRVFADRLGIGQYDRFDRHAAAVEERALLVRAGVTQSDAAVMAGDGSRLDRRRRWDITDDLAERELARIGLKVNTLALLAEQLALEPLELVGQAFDFLDQLRMAQRTERSAGVGVVRERLHRIIIAYSAL